MRALLFACLLAVAGASPGTAAEHSIEDFTTPGHYDRRWAEGVLAHGRDGERAYLSCTTPGNGAPVLVANRTPYDPPLDLRGRFVKLWLRVSDVTRLSTLEVRLSSDDLRSSWYALSVPIFADPEFGPVQSGSWVPLTLSLGEARVVGTPDRSAIDAVGLVVSDRGAQGAGPVTAWFGGLAAVDAPKRGVVSFTFDDGYDEHLAVAAPILAEHGFRGTAYVIPDAVGTRGYMTLEDLHALRDRYGWDVAAHHQIPFTEMTAPELERTVRDIQRFLSEHGFQEGGHLAFPLGKHDADTVLPLVRRHFTTARLASAGPETLPPADPYRLRVLNVVRETPPEELGRAAARARAEGEWLILMFHFLTEAPSVETEYAVSDFRRAVEAVAASGARVRTLAEEWRKLRARPASGPDSGPLP
jgi:peptidoglycan/xylan/chitin deacetylase (PgdA/CDA1 family)